MAFCTSCGHKNSDGGGFCENCGVQLKRIVNTTTAAPAEPEVAVPATASTGADLLPAPTSSPWVRRIVLGGVASVFLMAGAVGAWLFLNQDEEANAENLSAAVTRYLGTRPDFAQSTYCLKNFPYEKSPVTISGLDNGTQQWLDHLVKAGLYGPPRAVTSGGWVTMINYEYTKTDLGEKEMKDGRLCLATGLKVGQIGELTREGGKQPSVVALAQLSLDGIKPWVTDELRNQVIRDEALSIPFRFVTQERRWTVQQGGKEVGPVRRAVTSAARESAASGFGAFFNRLFSSAWGGNPVLGKWQGEGISALITFEFRESNAIFLGVATAARYEQDGNLVRVYLDSTGREPVVVKVIDSDTLHIGDGPTKMVVKRVK